MRQGRHLQERALLRGLRVPAQGLSATELAHAVHGDRTLQGPRPDPSLQARARPGNKISRRADLCRELDRAQLRPLLPTDGMRRCPAASGMDPELSGFWHDIRDRAGGAEQGDPPSRGTLPGFEVALPAELTERRIFSSPVEPCALPAD